MPRRSTIKALVIGASGHLGNAIVREFLDKTYRITACGRRSARPANLPELPVRYLSGDAGTSGQLDEWIAGHDLVVDAAAPYPLRTRLLLDAVCRHKARLVYVGSFVTLVKPRTSAQRFQHEMMRLAHPYFEVKELIESQVLEASRRRPSGRYREPDLLPRTLGLARPTTLHDPAIATWRDTVLHHPEAERD